MQTDPTPQVPVFPPTSWTLVLEAAVDGGNEGQAIAEFCRTYWLPLYVYARRHGHSQEEAADLTQDFFLELTRKNLLTRAAPHNGRLRTFLLACFAKVLGHAREQREAKKRGGGVEVLHLSDEDLERNYAGVVMEDLSPDRLYDRAWARALLENVLIRLLHDCGNGAGAQRFNVGKNFLPRGGDAESIASAAVKLGLSVEAAKAYIHRLRKRFGIIFREEVQRTLSPGSNVEEEIQYLYQAL